ncbi:MAG: hypothetical protein WCO68_03000 [Verrucomicrobiota bacterium]
MKQTTQWIAALFTVASAGLAMGCGCSTEKVRLEPVRERIVEQKICAIQQPILISRTSYVTETPSRTFWVAPSKENPAYVIGNVFTAPFRAITGRSLGEPDVLSSYNYRERLLEPVGERFTTMKSTSCNCAKKHCMTKKVTFHSQTLLPVGERLTTVKVIRTTPLLQPVGEQCMDLKVVHVKPVLMPGGEQCSNLRIIHSKPLLMPVGEKISTIRYLKMQPVLAPVGEQTIIRTTRTYVNPWSSCDY